MIKRIIKASVFVIVFGFLGYLLWQKSPLCASYYFNKGKQLYNYSQYDTSIKLFERSLAANPNNSAARYFLVLALSKGTPTYSHQESLYLIANSKNTDAAQNYAKIQIIALKQRLLDGLEDNYIYSAILNKDILRWNPESFPLKVYFEPDSSLPSGYKKEIQNAMNEWGQKSNFVEFTEVLKPDDCDIYVKFKNYDGVECSGSNICNYAAATTTTNETDKYNRLTRMIITFYKTDPYGNQFSDSEIYNAALHETGHALGITGHSDNPNDVMYSNNHELTKNSIMLGNGRISLSLRDLNTLTLLYRLAPTITNVRGWNSENLYYPPLILGNESEILQKKLDEYKNYIEQYPNYCGGYINIASIYASMGNNMLANEALDKAQELATNKEETYLIKYNKAILYYNNQNFKYALDYAKEAKQIKNDDTVNSLIQDINAMLEGSK